MNTAGRRRRRKKRSNIITEDELLIKELIDESKEIRVEEALNSWDKSMKMASFMTRKYMDKSGICNGFQFRDSFICQLYNLSTSLST